MGNAPDWPSRRALAVATLLYAAGIVIATWPVAARIGAELPSMADPVQHLWIMRWYKTCLLEGRLPFFCPDIQSPAGAPLAFFSPMHLQSALYLPLSYLTSNDVLIYNLLWFGGFLATGLGTFTIGWQVLRHRAAALLAGMLAMLSGPMMIHSIGHLELIYLGAVPLFLACWIRLVDRPSAGRVLAAVGAYVLTAMSAAYYALLVVVPAVLYTVLSLVRRNRGPDGEPRGTRARRWIALAEFVALALPLVGLLFGAQVWASAHGHSLRRSRVEFEAFGSPLWSYLSPTHFHALAAILPFNVHIESGQGPAMVECASYLGLATLLLLHRAARRRGTIPNPAFWWGGLLLLVVLSFGARASLGNHTFSLPSAWLWDGFEPFRFIRMPVRFNLLAVIFAAVLAGSGFRNLIESIRNRAWRALVIVAVFAVAIADLSFLPYPGGFPLPELPEPYRRILADDPEATFLDAPSSVSSGADTTSALACYWQSLHGGRTTAGYSGLPNPPFDDRAFQGSPFSRTRLSDPDYLADPDSMPFGLVADAPFDDYTWLFLRANGLAYLVIHEQALTEVASEAVRQRLGERLARARIAGGEGISVYDRERLSPPSRPVLVCLDGWRRPPGWLDPRPCHVTSVARLAVYVPRPNSRVRFRLEGAAFEFPTTVRLTAGGRELARWQMSAGDIESHETVLAISTPGYQEWVVEVDASAGPGDQGRRSSQRRGPAIRVRSLLIAPADDPDPGTLAAGEVSGWTVLSREGRGGP